MPGRRGHPDGPDAEQWAGTLVAVFQPAEESADGAKTMLADGLAELVGDVDVAMAQHVLPMPPA